MTKREATLEGYSKMSDSVAVAAASWVMISEITKDFNKHVRTTTLQQINSIIQKAEGGDKLTKEERELIDNYNYKANA